MFSRLARKTAAAALALALTAAVLVAAVSFHPAQAQTPASPTTPTTPPTAATPATTATTATAATVIPTSTSGNIPLLAATSCTDGTFVDTATYPTVAGANNDLVDDCQTLVQIQNHWAANTSNDSLQITHPLRTWGTATTQKINTWDRITVTSGRITRIGLDRRGLETLPGIAGTIPTQIGNLANLTYLNLSGHDFTGGIPTQIGQLTNLTELWLTRNSWLTGPIPTQIGNLTNLTRLELRSSGSLTGPIPTQIGQLANLTRIDFNVSRLTGSIPTQLGNLANLTELDLGFGRLTGSIPTQIGNLTNLTRLWLVGNRFTGSIPTQLGQLTNLASLNLSQNQLSGSIPTQLGQLTNLFFLDLSENQLSGSIPTQLGQLTKLDSLDLSENQLSGSIPTQLGSIPSLRQLILTSNRLTGLIPDGILSVQSFQFCNNYLTGVACQLSDSTPTTPSRTPGPNTDTPAPNTDTPAPSSSTTTTTIAAGSTSSGVEDPQGSEQPSSPLWRTLTVEPGGTTASQIRQALGLTSQDAVYAWDTAEQRWQRISPTQTIAAGTTVSFRPQGQVDDLEGTNLGGTRQTALVSRWNVLSAPAEIEQPSSMFASQLINCGSNAGIIIAVASYSPTTQQWSLWLPCHPRTQTRLTTGDNPPYNSLTSISPQDTLYIYARTSQPVDIAWNSDASQYQPS